ncbi:MAG TPA: hypothetical protein DEB39_03670 [Planctomycetaceae bacterium]|nr:hypothetical protein [Planctomycetaceae bacterium]
MSGSFCGCGMVSLSVNKLMLFETNGSFSPRQIGGNGRTTQEKTPEFQGLRQVFEKVSAFLRFLPKLALPL